MPDSLTPQQWRDLLAERILLAVRDLLSAIHLDAHLVALQPETLAAARRVRGLVAQWNTV